MVTPLIYLWRDLQTILHGLTTMATFCSIGGDANDLTALDIESMKSFLQPGIGFSPKTEDVYKAQASQPVYLGRKQARCLFYFN
jgi:hypothetical protein